jgi:hypothetical protein
MQTISYNSSEVKTEEQRWTDERLLRIDKRFDRVEEVIRELRHELRDAEKQLRGEQWDAKRELRAEFR